MPVFDEKVPRHSDEKLDALADLIRNLETEDMRASHIFRNVAPELLAQNDALELIANSACMSVPDCGCGVCSLASIAREALDALDAAVRKEMP